MKSMRGEVLLKIEAEKAWEMYRDNKIISQINPDMLANAHYIQGDGSPGTLRLFKLGPAVSNYVKESTEKIERVEKGKSVTYQVVDGELFKMYNPYKVTFSFTPLQQQSHKCLAEWKVDYDTIVPSTPPPEKARDFALAFLKCFDHFHIAHSPNN